MNLSEVNSEFAKVVSTNLTSDATKIAKAAISPHLVNLAPKLSNLV